MGSDGRSPSHVAALQQKAIVGGCCFLNTWGLLLVAFEEAGLSHVEPNRAHPKALLGIGHLQSPDLCGSVRPVLLAVTSYQPFEFSI